MIETFKKLSNKQKILIGAGSAGLLFFILKPKKDLSDTKGSKDYLQQAKNILNNGLKQNQGLPSAEKDQQKLLTLPLSQYSQLATTLQTAMQGVGTNEDAVFRVFNQLSTNFDVLKLTEVFGMKNLSNNPLGFGSESLNLIGWINAELSESEIRDLNKLLRSRQITFQF
jgi:hypothetical protein